MIVSVRALTARRRLLKAAAAALAILLGLPAPGDGGPRPRLAHQGLHALLVFHGRQRLLVRVTRPINKDTEMHPLVRWQFRGGIEEKDAA
mgnify:CR=1 FL=1